MPIIKTANWILSPLLLLVVTLASDAATTPAVACESVLETELNLEHTRERTVVSDVELVLDARAQLGEGALWHARTQKLLWVDIMGKALHTFDPLTGFDSKVGVGQFVGTVVPAKDYGVLLGLKNGFAHLDLKSNILTFIAGPELHLIDNRMNDGKVDRSGNHFCAGTMSMPRVEGAGSLYCLSASDLRTKKILSNVTISNGIDWSPDNRTMYYIDTPTLRVRAFDFDDRNGQLSNARTVITIPPGSGHPDGMTLDTEGMLWIAMWGAGEVTRWDPRSGQLLERVAIPAPNVTSVAFGGPELKDLYVTTARTDTNVETLSRLPHSGGVFRVRTQVAGLPATEFNLDGSKDFKRKLR